MSVTISGLPSASALTGTEPVPIVQSSATVQTTAQAIADLASSDVTSVNGHTGVVVLTASDVGAIATGTTIAATTGGTGLTSYAQGDTLYASATNTLTQLAKSTSATRYISNTGTTNNPAWAQVALATGVSGTLPLANGGTGQVTANAALNALLPTQSAQSGKFLTTDGSNTSWATAGGGSALLYSVGLINGTTGAASAFSLNVTSSSRVGTGHYDVFYNAASFTQRPVIVAAIAENTQAIVVVQQLSNVEAEFFVYSRAAGTALDANFTFHALGI